LNVADAGSRRLRRVNLVGPVQPTRMQETEAFREGEGMKVSRIQVQFTMSRKLRCETVSDRDALFMGFREAWQEA